MESVQGAAATVLLTGLPRSGTTLVCALLNELPETVALIEPIPFLSDGDHGRALAQIDDFVGTTRDRAVRSGEVISRHICGLIPGDLVSPPASGEGLRSFHQERGVVRLGQPVTPNFHLFIKHLGEFTAMADPLAKRYPLVAIVRNPLHVLASWQTIDLPINRGHLRSAECFSPALAADLSRESERIRRQVLLLAWLLGIYRTFPPDRILRYEDIVQGPRASIARLSPRAMAPTRSIAVFNAAQRYASVDFVPLARALQSIEPLVSHFYPGFAAQLETCLDGQTI
ncbi:hypothetical protein JCM14124_05450 [Humidesulfovibrio idahonensis]